MLWGCFVVLVVFAFCPLGSVVTGTPAAHCHQHAYLRQLHLLTTQRRTVSPDSGIRTYTGCFLCFLDCFSRVFFFPLSKVATFPPKRRVQVLVLRHSPVEPACEDLDFPAFFVFIFSLIKSSLCLPFSKPNKRAVYFYFLTAVLYLCLGSRLSKT